MSDLTGQTPTPLGDDQKVKPFHARRSFRIIGAIIVLAAIGGGSFAIASTVSSSSTPTAAKVPPTTVPTISRGPARAGQRLAGSTVGTVSSVQPTSFMVKSRSGTTVTVEISSSTTFHEQGKSTTKYSDVSVGDLVAIAGKKSGSDLNATSVTILPAGGAFGSGSGAGGSGGGFRGRGNFGTVQSVGTQSFVISSRSGSTLTVKVSASTQFTDRSVSNASIKTVKVGDIVIVSGTTSGNTITATSVVILPAGSGFGGGGGDFGGGGHGFGGGSSGSAGTN